MIWRTPRTQEAREASGSTPVLWSFGSTRRSIGTPLLKTERRPARQHSFRSLYREGSESRLQPVEPFRLLKDQKKPSTHGRIPPLHRLKPGLRTPGLGASVSCWPERPGEPSPRSGTGRGSAPLTARSGSPVVPGGFPGGGVLRVAFARRSQSTAGRSRSEVLRR